MVENFGSYLKHERELRGVPLEEISEAKKFIFVFLKLLKKILLTNSLEKSLLKDISGPMPKSLVRMLRNC